MLNSAQEIVGYLWATLGLYWVFSARRHARARAAGEPQKYRILRLAILAITFTLLLSHWLRLGPLAWRFIPDNTAIRALGIATTTIGLALATWARLHLGENWSDKVETRVGHELVRTGPYAYFRHPIYSGVLLGVAGSAIAVGEWRGVLAFAILTTSYAIKAKREERLLANTFGASFDEHRRHTVFLVPRLRRRKPEVSTGLDC